MIYVKRCSKCGEIMECTEVIATLPPIHVYTCPKCGNREEE